MGEELGQVVCEPENADGDVEAGNGPYGERTLDVTPPGVNWGGSRCEGAAFNIKHELSLIATTLSLGFHLRER